MKKGFQLFTVLLLLSFLIISSSCSTTGPGSPGVAPGGQAVYHETKVMGDSSLTAGSPGAVRILTYNPSDSSPVAKIPVKVYLESTAPPGNVKEITSNSQNSPTSRKLDKKNLIFSGLTDEHGTTDAKFTVPETCTGRCHLVVATGEEPKLNIIDSPVTVAKKAKIYLSVDKPMYQPGQKMRIRVLALGVPNLKPVADTPVSLTITDPKGNEVLKHSGKTSAYGILHISFGLAHEVNMGDYQISAQIGGDKSSKNVAVKKYVLPKYKITFEKDRKYYLPGDTLKGDVQVNYFFGKPVTDSNIAARLSILAGQNLRLVSESRGTTDEKGHYHFEMQIPTTLAGAVKDGKTPTVMEVVVTDPAEHKERSYREVAISDTPLKIDMYAETGILRVGMENQIYLLTSYPDGTPAEAAVTLKFQGKAIPVRTDPSGITSFTVKPELPVPPQVSPQDPNRLGKQRSLIAASAPPTFVISAEAVTPRGEKSTKTTSFAYMSGDDIILLRSQKAKYKVGDTLQFEIYSTKGKGTCYVDFIKNGQIISTKAVQLSGKVHPFFMEATPDLSGVVQVHAYRFTKDPVMISNARIYPGYQPVYYDRYEPDVIPQPTYRRIDYSELENDPWLINPWTPLQQQQNNGIVDDSRTIFVQSPEDLIVKTTMDKTVYRPGEDANISFSVTDKNGSPVAAALGVTIVDEAVFAMGEMKPGLERHYFMLDKSLMASQYEVHGSGIRDLAMSGEELQQSQKILEAAILSRIPPRDTFAVNLDSYEQKLQECYKRMEKINTALQKFHEKYHTYPKPGEIDLLVTQLFLNQNDLIDPWGNKFFLSGKDQTGKTFEVISPGSDGKGQNNDDLAFGTLAAKFNPPPAGGYASRVHSRGYYSINGMEKDNSVMREDAGAPQPKASASMTPPMLSAKSTVAASPKTEAPETPAVRLRDYFPETLYVNPELVTNEKGTAEIKVPMADSITTWRMAAFANSLLGQMGGYSGGIKVFQDFFIDIDFPVALIQDDEISIPIAVYNYLKTPQTVKLTVDTKEKWFQLLDKPAKSITIKPDEVKSVHFRIKATQMGYHSFTVHAGGNKAQDAIKKEIEVLPRGRMVTWSTSDLAVSTTNIKVPIPEKAFPGSKNIQVRLYPAEISMLVEGLDKVLVMPGGCFEQTNSSLYPDIMILQYLKRINKASPELQEKAEGYIRTGLQRLVTFEVQGGGFSLYGGGQGDVVLTAMGLLEFQDMAKVIQVDEKLINRTRNWLFSRQNPDGSWPSREYRSGNPYRNANLRSGDLRTTAYIVWTLAESGYDSSALRQGIKYLKSHTGGLKDPYVLALAGNALLRAEPGSPEAKTILEKLKSMGHEKGDTMYWKATGPGIMYSYGNMTDMEATSLVALAFLRAPGYENLGAKAITYIVSHRDGRGTWHSTQTTMLAMRALIQAQDKLPRTIDAEVTVTVNGKKTENFSINSNNVSTYFQADFSSVAVNGSNDVEIKINGKGSCYYQVTAGYYLPWELGPQLQTPLSVNISYDRTQINTGENLKSTVFIRNNTRRPVKNVMIEMATLPGFTINENDLERYVNRKFRKFSMAPRNILIYGDSLEPGKTISFDFRQVARYPMKIKTPETVVYEYYMPQNRDTTQPVEIVVR